MSNQRIVDVTPAPIVEQLRERAAWYRDGCFGLNDVAEYRASGDLERDAASDLDQAVAEIERLLERLRAGETIEISVDVNTITKEK